MTIEMFHQATKEEIARLHPQTKRELLAYSNNQLAIIVGRADMIASNARNEADLDAALVIARTGRKWARELEALFY